MLPSGDFDRKGGYSKIDEIQNHGNPMISISVSGLNRNSWLYDVYYCVSKVAFLDRERRLLVVKDKPEHAGKERVAEPADRRLRSCNRV